ncbi:putative membrane protein [Bacillus mycoides]|nr:putative membrane protein [Bacillus mycoides]
MYFMIHLTGISILLFLYWCIANQYIVVKWNVIVKKFNENVVFGIFIICMLFWMQYLFQLLYDR